MFKGKGFSILGNRRTKKAEWFKATIDFWFGGVFFREGEEIKQFETENFGWTVRKEKQSGIPYGHMKFAKE